MTLRPTPPDGPAVELSAARHTGRPSAGPAARTHLAWLLTGLLLTSGCAAVGLSSKDSHDAAQSNADLGAQYLQRGNIKAARFKLEKALEQDDTNAEAHLSYALLKQRTGESEQARLHFERAIELEPEEGSHRNTFGVFLCEVRDYDQATTQFDSAAGNPYYETPEFALDNAGLCMLDANRLARAETFLRDALRENPRFAKAYLHMAELLRRQSRLTVADAYYQRFQAYGSDTAESLLLGMQIRRDIGDVDAAKQYASRLLNEFPASQEAGEYLSQPLN